MKLRNHTIKETVALVKDILALDTVEPSIYNQALELKELLLEDGAIESDEDLDE
jgi:hypothetical protein